MYANCYAFEARHVGSKDNQSCACVFYRFCKVLEKSCDFGRIFWVLPRIWVPAK